MKTPGGKITEALVLMVQIEDRRVAEFHADGLTVLTNKSGEVLEIPAPDDYVPVAGLMDRLPHHMDLLVDYLFELRAREEETMAVL